LVSSNREIGKGFVNTAEDAQRQGGYGKGQQGGRNKSLKLLEAAEHAAL
jgi:hypothetical protein